MSTLAIDLGPSELALALVDETGARSAHWVQPPTRLEPLREPSRRTPERLPRD